MTEEKQTYTIIEYILFKIDRSIAIVGLISIGLSAVFIPEIPETAIKVIAPVVSGLCFYLGARGGKS